MESLLIPYFKIVLLVFHVLHCPIKCEERKGVRSSTYLRRKNFVLYRVYEPPKEKPKKLMEAVLDVLNNDLGSNVTAGEIDDVYRLGEKIYERDFGRPILVKCRTEWRKKEIKDRRIFLMGSFINLEDDTVKSKRIDRRRRINSPPNNRGRRINSPSDGTRRKYSPYDDRRRKYSPSDDTRKRENSLFDETRRLQIPSDDTGGRQSSPSDDTGGRQSSSSDDTGGRQSSPSDDTGGRQSSSSVDTGGRQSSPSDDTGGRQSSPSDDTGGRQRSPSYDTGGRQRSPSYDIGGRHSSPSDDTGGRQSSPSDDTGGKQSSPSDDTGGMQSSPSDDTGGSQSSPSDDTGGRQSSPSDDTGGRQSSPSDDTGGRQSSPSDDTGGRQSSTSDDTGGRQSSPSDDTGGRQSSPSETIPSFEIKESKLSRADDKSKQTQYTRKRKLVFFGVKEKEPEGIVDVKRSVLNIINHTLGIANFTMDDMRCYRLGAKKSMIRPILVKCTDPAKRIEILNVRDKLRGTGMDVKDYLERKPLRKTWTYTRTQ